MRILSITAQKPHSTGSGVYLTELVRNFQIQGHRQAVIAGIYQEDEVTFPKEVGFYPVYFHSERLPYAIAGMSDEMPYESTVYSQMSEEQVEQFVSAYTEVITNVIEEFEPELIISHHLFLLTALVQKIAFEIAPSVKVVGLCHGSDLRQYKKSKEVPALRGEFIYEHLRNLDEILALHEEQKIDICETYQLLDEKVRVIGSGYNGSVFRKIDHVNNSEKTTLLFAGKISKAKGVMSLIRSLSYLKIPEKQLELHLAGGYGSEEEYDTICSLAKEAPYEVCFLGKLSQQELAIEMNRDQIFVLPSFYEGLPLVLMEAMACEMEIIATDLPGVQKWMNVSIPDHRIQFVVPPDMTRVDEPKAGEEESFEIRLANEIQKCIDCAQMNAKNPKIEAELGQLSWGGICKKIVS